MAAEELEECVACVSETMPNVVYVAKVESVTYSLLRPFFERRKVDCVLFGGGSPFKGTPPLTHPGKDWEISALASLAISND